MLFPDKTNYILTKKKKKTNQIFNKLFVLPRLYIINECTLWISVFLIKIFPKNRFCNCDVTKLLLWPVEVLINIEQRESLISIILQYNVNVIIYLHCEFINIMLGGGERVRHLPNELNLLKIEKKSCYYCIILCILHCFRFECDDQSSHSTKSDYERSFFAFCIIIINPHYIYINPRS